MQADAAERLQLAPGDRLCSGVEFTLTGTWRIDDHLDPRWLGDTIVTDGTRIPTTARSSSTTRPGRVSKPIPACAGPSSPT